jgi:hypothetical protein
MKKLLFLALLGLTGLSLQAQTTAAAKAQGVGANVSVKGVVMNGQELGIIRYIQDVTGGIAAYGGAVASLNLGDSVLISGPLTEFYNLYEISPPTVNLISTNAHIFTPSVVTAAAFSEPHEGMLIKIQNCVFNATGNFSSTATNYTCTCAGASLSVRSNSVLANQPIPTGTVDIVGLGSQFCGPQSSSGCTTGYQILPRKMTDFTASGSTTGIKEETFATVSVYPNPASKEISFRLSNNETPSSVIITDVLGKTVFTSTENKTTLNISDLPKGFYSLVVSTEKNKYKAKFIVE